MFDAGPSGLEDSGEVLDALMLEFPLHQFGTRCFWNVKSYSVSLNTAIDYLHRLGMHGNAA